MSDKQGNVPQFSDYEKELLLDGGWQCSFCERVNANYVGSCEMCIRDRSYADLDCCRYPSAFSYSTKIL